MKRCHAGFEPEVVRAMQLFRQVSLESVQVYLEECEYGHLQAGEVLLTPEEENRDIFLIVTGQLAVHLDSLRSPALMTLCPGECAGEMSMIDNHQPSAYVVAIEPCQLLIINQQQLWAMLGASHGVAFNLLLILSRRMRHGNSMIRDVLEIQSQLEYYATVDGLTGLYNRRWLDEMFPRTVDRCRLQAQTLYLIMLDLDHFKECNDRHGHLAGDQVLMGVARVLRQRLRPRDLVARFGGEEFAIMLMENDDAEALAIAERLRQSIGAITVKCPAGEVAPTITASLGLAKLLPTDTVTTLLHRADLALYRAKQEGRDRVCIY